MDKTFIIKHKEHKNIFRKTFDFLVLSVSVLSSLTNSKMKHFNGIKCNVKPF